jgi:hypothetical protein
VQVRCKELQGIYLKQLNYQTLEAGLVLKTHMKHLNLKLIIAGILLIASFFVIGEFRLRTVIYPVLLIYLVFLIYKVFSFVKSPVKKSVLGLLGIFILGVLAFLLLHFMLCGYGERDDKYINKKNKNIKLTGRDFSCFGTAEDLILYKTYSITDYFAIELHFKTFPDYKNVIVDTTIWEKIDK